jgi:nitroreductase
MVHCWEIYYHQKGDPMFLDLLRRRRSVRRFSSTPVESEKVELLLEAMLRSPSSRSRNPWYFIVVREPERLKALSRAKPHGASFVKDAQLAIVVCADPSRCDVWIEDCSIATHTIHLAAADLGLGSCWVQIRLRDHEGQGSAEDYLRMLLDIPPEIRVEALVAIGYPAEDKPGHSRESLLYERVGYERYGKGHD